MNDDSYTSNDSRIARRTVLSGVASSGVAIAGCSASPSETGDPETEPASEGEAATFTSVAMDGSDLVVKLTSSTNVDSLNLIGPNEELGDSQRVQEGARRVSFQLLGEGTDGYTSGQHRIVAVTGDETIDETTITLSPEITITGIKRAQNHPDLDWDKDSPSWKQFAAVTIENTGNAPSYLTEFQWEDSPHTKVAPSETLTSYPRSLLPPGETTIYTTVPIYRTEDPTGAYGAIDCGNLERDTLTVTGNVQAGENPSFSQTIEYGGTKYSCELTIVDNGAADSPQTTNEGDT